MAWPVPLHPGVGHLLLSVTVTKRVTVRHVTCKKVTEVMILRLMLKYSYFIDRKKEKNNNDNEERACTVVVMIQVTNMRKIY